ncbi:MAG: poly(A) polymerase [Gammaproteobacteria bacterium RIFCSPLOWO2_02_FULL_52_10]|nr:MAG: poly(A) polymerase [Gammaproteobacteria bacterium RIFCSPLOWO2_02_FULL_52_10]OGT85258.1 MAG: poly(A) polymerase [Gammaproteobacteria bacterium RIFCSPLOWO2_12_FULL_52_10]
MSANALKVLYRLCNAGFDAYLVGGSVRDLLLGREPKDFDVVTNARPEQVRELFRNSHLIGRRFRLVHVRFGNEVIEVSTFRTAHHIADGEGHVVDGTIIRDNVYGTIDDDVWRRDLTVNALFYNIKDFTVIDYVGGLQDIQAGRIRLIGDPEQRYIEDPVRLLRVVRFAVKLGFRIDPATEAPIRGFTELLRKIPPARLFEETLKLFLGGYALQTFEQLRRYDLFIELFPQTEAVLTEEEGGFPHMLLVHALQDTDSRLAAGKPITPGYLIAALLWMPMQAICREHVSNGMAEMDAVHFASDVVISKQIADIALPRQFTKLAREIWQLQLRLRKIQGKYPLRLLEHPRFRAAYDFLLLRAKAGENVQELADWWTGFQQEHPVKIDQLRKKPAEGRGRRRRRRR